MQLYVLFTLGFPAAPLLNSLTSLHTITRRTVLQKVPHRTLGALCACKHMVSGSISLRSRGPFHLSLTVLYAIGHWVVFRLGGWAPRIPTGLHVSGSTLDTASLLPISSTWLSHSMADLPRSFDYLPQYTALSEPPKYFYFRFGLFRVRSPLLAESRLISLPRPT